MKADQDKAKAKAVETLKAFGIMKPPVDPEIIAKAMAIDVVYADFKPEIAKKISGFIRFEPLPIVVNQAISSSRMTFTIAHELAIIFCIRIMHNRPIIK